MVAIITPYSEQFRLTFKTRCRGGLRELGYLEGQNFTFEFRSVDGKADRLPELAAELVGAGRCDRGDLHAVCFGGEAGDNDYSDCHGGCC